MNKIQKLRIALSYVFILISIFIGYWCIILLFSGESIIDQGNPPIKNVFRFEGGLITPGLPLFFLMCSAFAVAAGLIVKFKIGIISKAVQIPFYISIFYALLSLFMGLASYITLVIWGHKYA